MKFNYATITAHLFLFALTLTFMACDTATGQLDGDLAVIEAFIFAGEPVDRKSTAAESRSVRLGG